jgi:hypothetical protein
MLYAPIGTYKYEFHKSLTLLVIVSNLICDEQNETKNYKNKGQKRQYGQ